MKLGKRHDASSKWPRVQACISFLLSEHVKWFLVRLMGAYSFDLRKRIIDAVEPGEHTKCEITEKFNVLESFMHI